MSDRSDERAPVRGCDGCAAEPVEPGIENRPGLPALRYRIGTWSSFVARMLADLRGEEVVDDDRTLLPLASLNIRATDDPSIALVDTCAVIADVLTFYQERIANEGFLRTATEHRSVLELARAIGYELSPGVAASTYLAFTVDDTPATPIAPGTAPIAPPPPRTARIPRGSQVQSVPGPGELPQTFETVEDLVAHAEWNELRPRRTQAQSFAFAGGKILLVDASGAPIAANRIYLAGTSSGLAKGDLVLAMAENASVAARVLAVDVDDEQKQTIVRVAPGDVPALPSLPSPVYPPPATTGRIELAPLPLDPRMVSEKILPEVWDEGSLTAFCAVQRWDPAELTRIVAGILAARAASSRLLAFRQRLAPFGHNAPRYEQVRLQPVPDPTVIRAVLREYSLSSIEAYLDREASIADDIADQLTAQPSSDPDDWDAHPRSVWEDSHGTSWRSTRPFDLFLERAVQNLTAGGWVLLERGATRAAYAITDAADRTLTEFSLNGRATGLALDTTGLAKDATLFVRDTTAHVQSEALPLAAAPVLEPVEDRSGTKPAGANAIELDRMVVGLSTGQPLLLTGTTLDERNEPGLVRSEAVRLGAIVHREGYTTLYFTERLRHRYLRASVTLIANVARATHGQTVAREILGNGDGSAANQRFTLQKPPLTWVAAPTATGRQSTLTLRIDGTLWDEAPSLYGVAPDARSYVVRIGDDGRATVLFGNGVAGARLPTGASNVVASYRSGIGIEGQVSAGSLSMLMSRPLGVRGVTNPLAADGAADPEGLEGARRNAPSTVLTLGRVVSLRDYEDFARSFAGVGKAQAVPLWDGESQLVHLTVAAADGTPVDRSSALFRSLNAALAASSGGLERVRVDGFQQRYFRVDAIVSADPRADAPAVFDAANRALRETFSFERRGFGQRVTSAEVVTVIQSVRGVVATTLVALVGLDDASTDEGTGVAAILPAAGAHWESGAITRAELLVLHPQGVKLTPGGQP